jgi:hypothetical protein
MTLVLIVLVDVVSVGGGGTAAGQSISPASAETVSARIRIIVAQVWCKVFM